MTNVPITALWASKKHQVTRAKRLPLMDLVSEIRARARKVIWPAIAICVLGYLIYHIIHGDRGLLAWRTLKTDISEAQRELAVIETERAILERNVRLLHPNGLDADMLDEWARRHLNYGQPEDVVIFLEPPISIERRTPRSNQ